MALAEWSIGSVWSGTPNGPESNEMETEYNNFVQRLSDFVNQEIAQFGHRLTLLEGTSRNIQNIDTQVPKITQAMSGRMDKVEQQMEPIHSDLWRETGVKLGNSNYGLKKQISVEVDQKIAVLEARLEARMNETRQITATHLQEIKDLVVVVEESQQKMCGAIERMSQRRAGVVKALVERRPREEDGSVFNATIVVETISCEIVRNGRRSRRSTVPPQGPESPAPFAHMDGSLGWSH